MLVRHNNSHSNSSVFCLLLQVLFTVLPLLLLITTKLVIIIVVDGHEGQPELSCGSAHHVGDHRAHDHAFDDDDDDHNNRVEANHVFMETWWQHRRRQLQDDPDNNNNNNNNNEGLSFVVPVCFHVIRPTVDGAENITLLDAVHLQRQLDALNRGFSARSCCDPELYEWCSSSDPAAPASSSSKSPHCSLDSGFTFAMGQFNNNNNNNNVDDDDSSTGGTLNLTLGTMGSTTTGTPCLTRSYNDSWYESAYGSTALRFMQSQLRQGDATVLNVYFTDLRDPFGARNVVGGIATFPDEYGLAPELDGIFVSLRTILPRDETATPPETYHTIVHETGHWLGLYHVFAVTSGCDNDGDYVDDTPWQKSPSTACDVVKDTCPDRPGRDSIHNYMDYTRDSCSFAFTPGQIARMQAFMVLVRQGHVEHDLIEATVTATRSNNDNDNVILVGTVATRPVDLAAFQTQQYRLKLVLGTDHSTNNNNRPAATITCASDGRVRLRMRKDAAPNVCLQLYDCTSATTSSTSSSSSNGTCTILHVQDQVFAVVQASGRGADQFQLRCTVRVWDNNATVVPLTLNTAEPFSLSMNAIVVGPAAVLFRLEEPDLPRDTVVSCALDRNGVAQMAVEFDYRADYLDRVLPYEQCATDGSRCSQEIVAGQTAMNVVVSLSNTDDVEDATGGDREPTYDLSLLCTATPRLPDIDLLDGVASPALVRLVPFGMQIYQLDIETGSSQQVQCRASATSGDGSLSLIWADRPHVVGPYESAAVYECRIESFVQSSQDYCNASYFGSADIYFPVPSLYAIVEAASTPIENLSVVCSTAAQSIEPIESGVTVGPLSLPARKDKVFELRVASSAHVECVANSTSSTSPSSSSDDDDQLGGEIDLYLRLDEPLDITIRSRANCSAETSLSYETCSLTIPPDSSSSSLFVTLLPFGGAVENVMLRCTVNLTTNVPVTPLTAAPGPATTTTTEITPPVVPVSTTTTERPVVTLNDAPSVVGTASATSPEAFTSFSVPTCLLLLLLQLLSSVTCTTYMAFPLAWY